MEGFEKEGGADAKPCAKGDGIIGFTPNGAGIVLPELFIALGIVLEGTRGIGARPGGPEGAIAKGFAGLGTKPGLAVGANGGMWKGTGAIKLERLPAGVVPLGLYRG